MKDLPDDFQWVSIANTAIFHSEAEARSSIRKELDYLNRGLEPEHRVPWARAGWYKDTTEWMREELSSLGYIVTKPVEQVSASPWGTVLKATTESEDVFLKASPSCCDEGAINEILSEMVPLHVSKRLVLDKDRRVFIARDHGESFTFWDFNEENTPTVLKDLAQVQKASIAKLDELRNAGLQVYEVGWVAENLDVLLDHEELLFMRNSDEFRKVRKNREVLRNGLRELERLSEGLPMTLVHGDIVSGNVYRVEGEPERFGFFDWDCAYISHPCLGALGLYSNEEVTDPYLEEWCEFLPINELRKILRLLRGLRTIFMGFRAIHELCNIEEHCREDCRLHIRLLVGGMSCFIRDHQG